MAVRKYRIPTRHGAIEGKTQSPEVQFYNLDVIIFAYDEAHLYISEKPKDSVDELALNNFDWVKKEESIGVKDGKYNEQGLQILLK